ncbi:hypothetical protein [Fodinibius salsisoli]|uniref:Uncharacterized protein n=1 Tax=Fodinibius salsisoli TaxID=2820877 RepID=A0ABT3PRS9_9BACT|nr:hypothetical protein [Fodinibius salsisoli]MCW9708554.1 hypothetical protein [Fodinibius salsisoli]
MIFSLDLLYNHINEFLSLRSREKLKEAHASLPLLGGEEQDGVAKEMLIQAK